MSARAAARRRWNLGALLVIGLVGVALAVLAAWPLVRPPDEVPEGASLRGAAAPRIDAIDLSGRAWRLDGAPPTVTWVNFWATSCVPCRTEMPAMQRLAVAYGERLTILGVDVGEEEGGVRAFADRYGISYPLLLDPRLENAARWGATTGLPRHYFVGRDGRVVREVIGPLEPARMAQLVEELLGPA